MHKTFLVVGSAHLDILARASSPESNHKDRVGTLVIDIGGTGGNIAINLANHLKKHSGLSQEENTGVRSGSVRFLATMNDSIYSCIIVDHLRNAGVEMFVTRMKGMPLNGFSAHLDASGEVISAVTASPLEYAGIDREKFIEAADGIDALIFDCNLSEADIQFVAQYGKDRDLPVYAALTSDAKCTRIKPSIKWITHAFMNRIEYRSLADNLVGNMTPGVMPPDLARIMGVTLIVTYDKDGVLIATPDGKAAIQKSIDADFPLIATRLGMGDALTASTIYHLEMREMSLSASVEKAMSDAVIAGQSEHTFPGDRNTIEKTITRFRHQAERDALTGLANRRFVNEHLHTIIADMLETDQGLCIMMIDIDHFKSINDTWGHDEGDRVIKGVASILSKHVRDSDILGRWGGEEFIVVMPKVKDVSLAETIAQRICHSVAGESMSKRAITVSIGYALTDSIEKDAEKIVLPADTANLLAIANRLINCADEALYKAKRTGRNRAVAYTPNDEVTAETKNE